MVAKSFQKFEICGDPYVVNGRQYVKLSNGRQVRWYTETEYYKMYPDEKKTAETVVQPTRPLKEVLGFDKGYVTICKGDTYSHLEWFKASEFRYSKFFGWYLCSTLEMPEDFPADLIPLHLNWEDVAQPDGTALKNETILKGVMESIMFDPSPSQHIGAVGDKIMVMLTVIKAIPLESYYGRSMMHIFEDENQNVFTWTTAAKSLSVGETYMDRGTVKDHVVYKNCNQTVLTRCSVAEV
jgi:hypothetical protein